jgi:5-methylcytosine-specific restriction protein A
MNKSFYSTTAWFKARARAIQRDHYTCQLCGSSVKGKGMAHVDHMVTRKARPDLELDLSNLVTYCVSCHSKKTRAFDSINGSGVFKPRAAVDVSGYPEAWR